MYTRTYKSNNIVIRLRQQDPYKPICVEYTKKMLEVPWRWHLLQKGPVPTNSILHSNLKNLARKWTVRYGTAYRAATAVNINLCHHHFFHQHHSHSLHLLEDVCVPYFCTLCSMLVSLFSLSQNHKGSNMYVSTQH